MKVVQSVFCIYVLEDEKCWREVLTREMSDELNSKKRLKNDFGKVC